MPILAFAVYGVLADCLTALAGYGALRLCVMIGRPASPPSQSPAKAAAGTTSFLQR